MSIADKYRPQFTYDDYVLWEGRWELIDGMPYAMSPAPGLYHQRVNYNLLSIFNDALKKSCKECQAYMPIDWKVNEKTVVQPDVSIVCGKTEKAYLDFTPALVGEILSPSTSYKDRHEKFELFEEEGVKYYLIVDPQFKKMEIYELFEKKYQPVSITPSQFEFSLNNDSRISVGFDGIWD